MAKNQTTRLKPSLLQADRDSLSALQATAGYAPANPAYALAAIATAQTALNSAQQTEVQANRHGGGRARRRGGARVGVP